MKFKTIIRGLLAATFLAGIMTIAAPQAHAQTAVTCVVAGEVSGDVGLKVETQEIHVTFVQTQMDCVGTFEGTTVNGTYSVTAEGPSVQNCAQGSGSGTISASLAAGSGPATVTGSYGFTRVGADVDVVGSLTDGTATAELHAELEFIPETGQTCTSASGITDADLIGDAVIASD